MIELLSQIPPAVLLLVFWGLPLTYGAFVTQSKVRQALELVADPSKTIDQVVKTRELDVREGDVLVPCALTRNVPWQPPRDMARVLITRGTDPLIIVDVDGLKDFSFSSENVRIRRQWNVDLIWGKCRDVPGGVPGRRRGGLFVLAFDREHLSKLPHVRRRGGTVFRRLARIGSIGMTTHTSSRYPY